MQAREEQTHETLGHAEEQLKVEAQSEETGAGVDVRWLAEKGRPCCSPEEGAPHVRQVGEFAAVNDRVAKLAVVPVLLRPVAALTACVARVCG